MKTIPASLINLIKSCFAGWNPSELGWNLRCATSDEIKSALINPALAGFHHKGISSTKWIYSDAGGFNWQSLQFSIKITVFFCVITCSLIQWTTKNENDAFYSSPLCKASSVSCVPKNLLRYRTIILFGIVKNASSSLSEGCVQWNIEGV